MRNMFARILAASVYANEAGNRRCIQAHQSTYSRERAIIANTAALICAQNLRQRVPLISSQRPYGVLTARIITPSQWGHLRTAPIGAAYNRREPTGRVELQASHCICAKVMSEANIS